MEQEQPSLPLAFKEKIEQMNGVDVNLVIQKELTMSDVKGDNNRFNIPIDKMIEESILLTPLERLSFNISVSMLDHNLRIWDNMYLKKWKLGKSEAKTKVQNGVTASAMATTAATAETAATAATTLVRNGLKLIEFVFVLRDSMFENRGFMVYILVQILRAANSQKFVKGEEVQPQKQSISPSFSLEDFSMLIDLTKQAKRRMCQSVIGMICKDRCVVGQSSIDVYKTYA
ncbi:hypothetical protein P8452_57106 [Trifolium repens]|nr:hypothetical protein P8452_57106 [Trifolium repens]